MRGCEIPEDSVITQTEREAAAFRWMAENYFGADFHYGDEDNPICVLTIRLPEKVKGISADLLLSIEAVMSAASPPPTPTERTK
jgi:hypothetical protein